jgi:hypothetical protein
LRRDSDRQEQCRKCFGWLDWPLTGGMAMQAQEHLPIGESRRELMGGMNRECSLADTSHSVDCIDPNHAPRIRAARQRSHQPLQLSLTPSE